jgi:hypothetical protein
VTAQDFYAENGGLFQEEAFPKTDRSTLFNAWLDQVSNERDGVQRAYVRWRGTRHIARRLDLSHSTLRFESRERAERTDRQLARWQERARKAKAAVPTRLVEEVEGAEQERAFSPVLTRR